MIAVSLMKPELQRPEVMRVSQGRPCGPAPCQSCAPVYGITAMRA